MNFCEFGGGWIGKFATLDLSPKFIKQSPTGNQPLKMGFTLMKLAIYKVIHTIHSMMMTMINLYKGECQKTLFELVCESL